MSIDSKVLEASSTRAGENVIPNKVTWSFHTVVNVKILANFHLNILVLMSEYKKSLIMMLVLWLFVGERAREI